MEQIFDTAAIRIMNIFENLTGVRIKDCIIENDVVYIVVEEGKIGLAIGKDGGLIKMVEKVIGKNIKLFEYNSNLIDFVKKLIPQAKEINLNGKIVEVRIDKSERAIVIGRNSKNLKILKKILERNHNVQELIIR